jgi:hypothetical protein
MRSRQASQAARDFYATYPEHPSARAARKLEAEMAIRGTEMEEPAYSQWALGLARAYREDRSFAEEDRFDVALAMDRLDLALRLKARKAAAKFTDWKQVGDKLRSEFGDLPALHKYFLDLARSADTEGAAAIAREVLQARGLSTELRARAQAAVARAGLNGRPLKVALSMIDGGELDLERQSGRITVVVAWMPSDPGSLDALKRYEKTLPQGTQFVYVALGGTATEVRSARSNAPFNGLHCHAPAGRLSSAAYNSLCLSNTSFPRVYVLNKNATVVGTGMVNELPALLVKASG